jgi:hypothetical protein
VPAVSFQVELSPEGVEDRLDGLALWFEERPPARSGSPLRARRSSSMPRSVTLASNSRPK